MPLFTLSYDKAKYDPTDDVLDYLLRENIISIDNDFNFDFKYQGRLSISRLFAKKKNNKKKN